MPDEVGYPVAGGGEAQRLLAQSRGVSRRAAGLVARSRRAASVSLRSMTAAARHLNVHRALQRAGGRSWYRFIRMRGGGVFDRVVPVTFKFSRHLAKGARRVSVIGPFNQWNPVAHPMRKTAQGDWTITVYLPPGRIIYHFDVDGVCWLDPNDEGRVPNAWGTHYSVRDLASVSRTSPAPDAPEVDIPITGGAQVVEVVPDRPKPDRGPRVASVLPPGAEGVDTGSWFRPPEQRRAAFGWTSSLKCRVEQQFEVRLLHARGDIDFATVAHFDTALQEALAADLPVVVSLRETTYLDSAALQCLARVRSRLSARDQRLVLAEPSRSVRRVLEVVGFDEVFPIFSSVEAALRMIGTAQDRSPRRE